MENKGTLSGIEKLITLMFVLFFKEKYRLNDRKSSAGKIIMLV